MNSVTPVTTQLSENHQFILACVGNAVSLISMLFLYHSTPHKAPPSDPPK